MGLIRMRVVHSDANFLILNNAIHIAKGSSVDYKDYRGFTKAQIQDDGVIKSAGRRVKT